MRGGSEVSVREQTKLKPGVGGWRRRAEKFVRFETIITMKFHVLTNGAKYKVDWLHGKIESLHVLPPALPVLCRFRGSICRRVGKARPIIQFGSVFISHSLVISGHIKRLDKQIRFLQQRSWTVNSATAPIAPRGSIFGTNPIWTFLRFPDNE